MDKMDPNFMSQTKKARRIKITNFPLYIGIDEIDLKNLIKEFIIENCFNDSGNLNPVLEVNINEEKKMFVVEFSSIEESDRILKLKKISLIGVSCNIIRIGDSLYGEENTIKTKI